MKNGPKQKAEDISADGSKNQPSQTEKTKRVRTAQNGENAYTFSRFYIRTLDPQKLDVIYLRY